MSKELADKVVAILEETYSEVELMELDGEYFVALGSGDVQVVNQIPCESELAEMFADLCDLRMRALCSLQTGVVKH